MYLSPLVDGILMLIVFFVFFSSGYVSKSGIEVNLPTSSSTMPSARDTHIVTVMKGTPPKLFFNEARVDLAQLTARLAAGKLETNQVTVMADRDASYGDVIEVAFRALKLDYQVSFATRSDNN